MPRKKFVIAPYKTGTQDNLEPWLILNDAFEIMTNMRVFRGRITKRPGNQNMTGNILLSQQAFSRLRINIGTTDALGNLGPTIVPGGIYAVGQAFTCGNQIYTVNVLGAPAVLLSTGGGNATYNTGTGAFTLAGGPATTDVYFYPALPVQHLPIYERPDINQEELFAFDTRFAYRFTTALGWQRVSGGTDVWSGTDTNFHQSVNYRGSSNSDYYLFVVNYNQADGIKYWNNTAWATITPAINTAGDTLDSALIIKSYKGRLLCFNVIQDDSASGGGAAVFYRNRIRWSDLGDPTNANAWNSDLSGPGFLDIPTKEAITAVGYVKDRLIVYCENSTWELVYLGNDIDPFDIQQIDSTLGVESVNSIIEFDKEIIGFGAKGIHACNGKNIQRIDNKIPNEIFNVGNNNSGAIRVSGVINYFTEEVYWSYRFVPKSSEQSQIYPNYILSYNYREKAWASFDDSVTAFGNFYNDQSITWSSLPITWSSNGNPWSYAQGQRGFRSIVAGNQQGFTYVIEDNTADTAQTLQITDIAIAGNIISLTVINHNLRVGSFIYINLIVGTGNIGDLNLEIYQVASTPDENTITINEDGIAGVYSGRGTILEIKQLELFTKQFNFFVDEAVNAAIDQVDFLVNRSDEGRVAVRAFINSSNSPILSDAINYGSALGNYILETSPYALSPFEQTQNRLWHSLYFNLEGDNIQFIFRLTSSLLLNGIDGIDPFDIYLSDFTLHAMVIYTNATSQIGQ